VDKVYPSEALVIMNGRNQKAMADQIMTVSKTRLSNLESKLSAADMRKVAKAIRTQLDL
jgi:mRNA interferase MazF